MNLVGGRLEIYVGVKRIANFLRVHERTVYRHLRAGRLPVKKDSLGRWVLLSLDYYKSLRSADDKCH
jgi:predicted site-specific integrase-resolvase